jgi:SAM-dependent methyltransferase
VTSFGRQFGLNATTYDAARPGYPDVLFDQIAAALPPGGSIVEIGAGTGIATRALLARGFRVTAVEPDAEMARQLLASSVGDLEVVISDFEHYQGPRRSFDAVVCAQAWHWFASAYALRGVKRLLRRDGVFATWWNIGSIVDEQRAGVLAAVFRDTSHRLPVLFRRPDLNGTIQELARLLQGDLGFYRVERLAFESSVSYTTERFVALMSTMSEVLALDEVDRREVLKRLSEVIDEQVALTGLATEVAYATLGFMAFRC